MKNTYLCAKIKLERFYYSPVLVSLGQKCTIEQFGYPHMEFMLANFLILKAWQH